jgi:hypothetical protein
VFSVIKFDNLALGQPAGFGMPVSGRIRKSASTAAVATTVCEYRQLAVDATVKGAFPGTSAWSPPI